jgi:hypothetical protein
VQLQIKFTKAKSDFYVLSMKSDAKAVFKFLDATLNVNRVQPSPSIQLAHAMALEKVNVRYDMTRVALKTFTFAAGSKSISIDNAVLCTLPKRLLFTMLKNSDFTGSTNTNPYAFHHFTLNNFMYVNGRQIPAEGLSLNTANIKTSTMAYQTLFSGLGIHHANTSAVWAYTTRTLQRSGHTPREHWPPDLARTLHEGLLHASLRPDS